MESGVIKQGMQIVWKPEWRDKGDDKYTFIAVTDEHPIDHGFDVSTIEGNALFFIRPIQTGGRAHMVESAKPLLPVVSFRLVAIGRQGASVEMRRTIGDETIDVRVETVSRSNFRRAFGKSVKDCAIGALIRNPVVEFPENGRPA
jgi:hypothetical protein